MDKRSDGVRCRRSLSASNRLVPSSTGAIINPGLKEDKIRFLLEAAEAARGGGGGSSASRTAVPPPPSPGPFAGMSLGQYVSALSSCLPGTTGIRPMMWNPAQPFQALPHNGVTSHAALLSSLAAAPLQSVQNITSTPAQAVPDRSILNSLLASYATGSPLFSINGLSGSGQPGLSSADAVGSSPIRFPSSEVSPVPQDLSMTASSKDKPEGASDTTNTCSTIGDTKDFTSESPLPCLNNQPTDFRASDGCPQWKDGPATFGVTSPIKQEVEVATDLSLHSLETSERGYRKSQTVPSRVDGTVDLSSRAVVDRKSLVPISGPARNLEAYSGDSRLAGNREFCCEDATCPHLQKLKELRRNVYRMLSVFTPYLDVAGAGIADVEADAVDDFLHEVIYSSKLDQTNN